MGGVYYVLNLIKSISRLEDKSVQVHVFYFGPLSEELDHELKGLDIVRVDMSQMSLPKKVLLKLIEANNPHRILRSFLKNHPVDALYPFLSWGEYDYTLTSKAIYWIPDFQHKFLPQLFSSDELKSRDLQFSAIAEHAIHLILSSHDALGHFKEFYPNSKAEVRVLQFMSLINESELSDKQNVLDKFKLSRPYFIVCNQFWSHKNHLLVLEALAALDQKNIGFDIVFTGKPHDHRDSQYFNKLSAYVESNTLNDQVKFLGFIDRADQLTLMRESLAVIQPSLFEGWSTVNEDAKTLGKLVIASDIPIHREQLVGDYDFFEPHSANELADIITKKLGSTSMENPTEFSLLQNQSRNQAYGLKLVSLFEKFKH
jgi:glycosyltransferase involved in cell wall biosynthesis